MGAQYPKRWRCEVSRGSRGTLPCKIGKIWASRIARTAFKIDNRKKMIVNLYNGSPTKQNNAVLRRIKVLKSVKQNHKQNKWVSFLYFFSSRFYEGNRGKIIPPPPRPPRSMFLPFHLKGVAFLFIACSYHLRSSP